MAFFYIINGEGKYLGNIKGTKVLFHKPNSATFLHRQTREMIEKLKARVEGLGATDLTIMEAEDEESAKAYMIATYCNGEASVSSPKRGRPAGGAKKEKAKKPQKKIDLNGVQKRRMNTFLSLNTLVKRKWSILKTKRSTSRQSVILT